MIIETIKLNEMGIFPELFLGICIIYLFLYGTFICYNSRFNFSIIQTSVSYLAVLTLAMVSFLLINDGLNELNYICFNNTIASDYLSFASKLIISISSVIFLLMIQEHISHQKINHFEYILIFLFAILGIFLLCSSNDLMTAYLSIELQSLSFYILAAFRKNSTYSVEAGLKYFVLGAFSSGLFLFGSSLIYGLSGSINFADFKDLFFWATPGYTTRILTNIDPSTIGIFILANKINLMGPGFCYFSEYDLELLTKELDYFDFLKSTLTLYGPLEVKQFLFSDFYFNEILFNLEDSKLYNNIISERLVRTGDSELVHAYGYIYPMFIKNLLTPYVHESETLFNTFFSNNNNPFFDYIFPKNIISLAESIKYFIEPNDYQTINYFYECKPFDIGLLQFALTFIFISLFFKLALAPFHTWSPDIYEGSPTSSTFFFTVIPKLSIFVLLLRIFYFGFFGFIDSWRNYVVLIAILSIIVGSVAGLEQRKLKSLLAYSSISHMGYLLISFSTGSIEGIQMLFNYLIIYMISGLCIWSVFVLTRLKNNHIKKQNKDLGDLILLNKSNNVLALIFATALFSIAGLPPTIGFLVKMSIFLSALESSMYFVALISILFSVISTFYYIRIVKVLYFEPVLVGKLYYPITTQKAFVVAFLFYSFLFLFINPTMLYLLSYKISLMF
jgi:NADH:ubiquinone oxidoreductase subunit 2 (subunit N)